MAARPSTTNAPEVLRLRSTGISYVQIGAKLGISRQRIGQIVRRARHRTLATDRIATIQTEMRACHDLDKEIPVADMMLLLDVSKKTKGFLLQHFSRQGMSMISLREMMDFLIPEDVSAQSLFDFMPAYRVRGIGKIHYTDLITAMTALDCGQEFRKEWTTRKDRLLARLLVLGGVSPHMLLALSS